MIAATTGFIATIRRTTDVVIAVVRNPSTASTVHTNIRIHAKFTIIAVRAIRFVAHYTTSTCRTIGLRTFIPRRRAVTISRAVTVCTVMLAHIRVFIAAIGCANNIGSLMARIHCSAHASASIRANGILRTETAVIARGPIWQIQGNAFMRLWITFILFTIISRCGAIRIAIACTIVVKVHTGIDTLLAVICRARNVRLFMARFPALGLTRSFITYRKVRTEHTVLAAGAIWTVDWVALIGR